MKFVRTCVAIAALAPMFATAALNPGQYSIAGIQQLCLKSDGTWYGTTFSGWSGWWGLTGKNYHIYGNYASGVGNDSMVFNKKLTKGSWTEWRDTNQVTVIDPATIAFVKTDCDAPALQAQGGRANPMQ